MAKMYIMFWGFPFSRSEKSIFLKNYQLFHRGKGQYLESAWHFTSGIKFSLILKKIVKYTFRKILKCHTKQKYAQNQTYLISKDAQFYADSKYCHLP